MPWDKVLSKFKSGKLHSGSKSGKKVKSRSQAIAIMLSEKHKADSGKKEYKSNTDVGPSEKTKKKLRLN